MRIAFVNPSVGFSDRRKSKPIGLAYIMAYIRDHGFPSDGFDFGDSEDDPAELARQYGLGEYDIVGFSVYNESFLPAITMARVVKERNPDALIIMGGPHATAVHEHIMAKYPLVDAVVRREGEEAMLEILRALADGGDPTGIAGTTWRNADGAPKVNCERNFIGELDELPFPQADFISHSGYPPLTYFDEVQGSLKRALSINSSRSCPYNCSFCGVLTIGRRYRIRSPKSITDEIAFFRKTDGVDYQHIYFSDANFFVSVKRCVEIAEALHAFDPELTFSFGTRVNQILAARDHIPRLKECGLRFIELGVESFSRPMLERLAKEVEPETNAAALALLERHDMDLALDFIMIDPMTTLQDIAINMQFFRTLGLYDYVPHDHLYTSLILYEGTPIRGFYEQRYGLEFDPDVLPDHRELIEDPAVSRLYWEMQWFRREWQERIDDALAQLELALESGRRDPTRTPWDDEVFAHYSLDAFALRHAPNLFLESLLDDAMSGFPVADGPGGVPALLPRLSYDKVTLPELVERVEAATAGLTLDTDLVLPGALGRLR
ncbi:B12-binding domain-containing radical SAM protein [Streptomyces sp. NPDC059373]